MKVRRGVTLLTPQTVGLPARPAEWIFGRGWDFVRISGRGGRAVRISAELRDKARARCRAGSSFGGAARGGWRLSGYFRKAPSGGDSREPSGACPAQKKARLALRRQTSAPMMIFFARVVALSKTFPIFAPDFAPELAPCGRRSLRRVKKLKNCPRLFGGYVFYAYFCNPKR